MTRGNRASRKQMSVEIGKSLRQDYSEDETFVRDMENDNYVKRASTSLQKQWTSSEDSGKPYNQEIKTSPQVQENTKDTESVSSDIKDKSRRSEGYTRGKPLYSDTHASREGTTSKFLGEKRRKRSKRIERRKFRERLRTTDRDYRDRTDIESSVRRYSKEESSFTDKSRRRKNVSPDEDEVPITDILKQVQEHTRTKYEEPVPLPELTTDTIYIQGRNGFSAVKIGGSRRASGNDTRRITKGELRGREECEPSEFRTHTLIQVAIAAQKFWKCMGLVYQGLLGGMALLHFIMIHIFFDISVEFISNYSIFSEVYTNLFSFLITLCVISIFDKFDLARLDMDHLREIYMDHTKTAIAIPLYLATFGLHQASSKIDDQLALMHYYNINETVSSNNTLPVITSDELNNWHKITMSKDLLAVLAWLFVSLGTRDNMLLMYLESMKKYASNVDSPR